jgi:hypothetical protein
MDEKFFMIICKMEVDYIDPITGIEHFSDGSWACDGVFGEKIYYDKYNNKIGTSIEGLFGGREYYGADGTRRSSAKGIFDEQNYDDGGESYTDIFGVTHYHRNK